MNRWIYRTKKWCALAVCAMLIPHGYEAVRQTVLGWPRKEAQESVISDAYIVKKQSFEAGSLLSSWNSAGSASGASSVLRAQNTSMQLWPDRHRESRLPLTQVLFRPRPAIPVCG